MRRSPNHRRGFTLIELLVGLGVSTLIMGAAAGVFVTTLHAWERGREEQELLLNARTAADTIEHYLRGAQAPDAGGLTIFDGMELGDADRPGHALSFISNAVGRFPRSAPLTDVNEVTIEYDPDLEDGLTLRIDSTPDDMPDDGGYLITLSELAREFHVYYFDGTEWVTEWTDQALPRAVEFRLALAPPQAAGRAGEAADDDAGAAAPLLKISRLIAFPTMQPAGASDEIPPPPGEEQPSGAEPATDAEGNAP